MTGRAHWIETHGPSRLELAWGAFALANLAAMLAWETWETIPFHFIWVSMTLLYGFRIWRPVPTLAVLGLIALGTGALILYDIGHGTQVWGELFEVPLMSAMFLAMVWHARRRQQALWEVERLADDRASLLAAQERFLHDASHELRTPVTIARGHLELLVRTGDGDSDVDIALDELQRIERILERLLLLAAAEEGSTVADVELEPFLADVFMRWTDVAPRAWRLGRLTSGTCRIEVEALRLAVDALLENAVKYTDVGDAIELSAVPLDGDAVEIRVADEGCGIPEEALGRIFDRFARVDSARSREHGGVGLGLAIVDAIAKAHGGTCTVSSSRRGSTFKLRLRAFTPAPPSLRAAEQSARELV